MLLTTVQRNRYWNLVDALVAFAANRAGRLDELYHNGALEPDDQVGAEVIDWVYDGHTDVIQEFVHKNPANLSPGDLNDVRRWHQGLASIFALDVTEQGESCLMAGGAAFVVTGIDYEPYELAHRVPAVVHTVLVPFCGRIVHLPTFQTLDAELDEGLVSAIRDMRLEATSEHRLARTGRELLHEASRVAKELHSGLAPSLTGLQESDAYLQGLEGMPQGQHRGKLAGLDWDERERQVDAYLAPRVAAHVNHAYAIFAAPVSRLADLLQLDTKASIESFAATYGVRGRSKMRKAELAEATAQAIAANARTSVDGFLDAIGSSKQVEQLRQLVEAGGRKEVSARDDASVGQLPMPRWPFVELFQHAGTMTAVVADELLDAFRTADWDAALAQGQAADASLGRMDGTPLPVVSPQVYADTVTALRGVAPLTDTAAAYLMLPAERRPEAPTTVEGVAQVLRQTDPETVDYDVMITSQGELLLETTLCRDNYEEVFGHPYWEDPDDGRYPGTQLAPFVVGIIARHRDIRPRPVSDDMLVGGGYFQWARTRPAVLALTRYLDAHVPDSADDLFFADGVAEGVIDLSHGGYDPQDLMDYLVGRGAIADERSMAAVAGLVMNALNDLPRWDNNGWTPRELFEGKDHDRG